MGRSSAVALAIVVFLIHVSSLSVGSFVQAFVSPPFAATLSSMCWAGHEQQQQQQQHSNGKSGRSKTNKRRQRVPALLPAHLTDDGMTLRVSEEGVGRVVGGGGGRGGTALWGARQQQGLGGVIAATGCRSSSGSIDSLSRSGSGSSRSPSGSSRSRAPTALNMEPEVVAGLSSNVDFFTELFCAFAGGAVGVLGTLVAYEVRKQKIAQRMSCPYCMGRGTMPCGVCYSTGVVLMKDKKSKLTISIPCKCCEGKRVLECLMCQGDGRNVPVIMERKESQTVNTF